MRILSSLASLARVRALTESTTMMWSMKSAARTAVHALALLFLLLAASAPARAANNAAFGWQTVPTTMVSGNLYTVNVTMANIGTTDWTVGSPYFLGSQNAENNLTWGGNRASLSAVSSAGTAGSFDFQVRAPAPGTYNFQWRMVQEGVEWFGAYTQNVVVTVVAPVNGAQVVGASVPASMAPGQVVPISVTMKNTGGTTWPANSVYRLGSTNPYDTKLWTVSRVNLANAVAPGQQYTFAFSVTAPTAGNYVMGWGMLQEGAQWFGDTSNSAVSVISPVQTPTMSVSRTPSPMTAGQAYTLSWSSTNATSVSRVCTAGGTGYTVNDAPGLSGSSSGTASTAWVGNPSSCVWRATGAGGTATFNETMTTNAAPSVEVVTYIHTDGLGSPVARSNASGQLVGNKTRYEPYGLTAAGDTPTIGFTGHVNDADTGLVYMQQRYYDPVAGRFLSIDPVTTDANTGGSFNRYVYANNSPYRYTDPDGRDSRDAQIAEQLRKEREKCGSYCSGGVSSSKGASASSGTPGAASQTGYEQGGQYELNPMGDPVNPNSPGVGVAQVIAGATLVGSVGAIMGSEIAAARVAGSVIDSNKVAHIFGQARHNLGGVLNQFGSADKAFIAIQKAAEAATRSLGTNGVFEVTVKVGGAAVTVRGSVVNQVVKIGTAFVK
jgi:RHS repeat-associated protein